MSTARLSRAIDECISASTAVDLLGRSSHAGLLLERLQECEDEPLLDKAAATSVVVVTPTDGLSAACARISGLLGSLAPLKAHVVENLLALVAASAQDPPRSALLLSLLAVALLGRETLEERDDGGLAAWQACHMLLANELVGAALRGLSHMGTPFTCCLQLPAAGLAGTTIELAEELIERLQIRTPDHESVLSCLERRRVPLAGAILIVRQEAVRPTDDRDAPMPWKDALRNTGAFRSGAQLTDVGGSSNSDGGAHRDADGAGGAAEAGGAGRDGGGGASGGSDKEGLRAGDAIVAADGKLLSLATSKKILADSRRPYGSVPRALTLTVLRVLPSEDARKLAIGFVERPGKPLLRNISGPRTPLHN
uniref:PDZ domain-containing protein n=1 Tax=Emiliania huxleyi TaxID=2903 RepID=A0A7S3TJZ5_EMIHU